ncbi:rna-processing protein [Botryosphaeria dothidea]|uniref:Rna-processing protein n=1 Tax=Botryosphaeria dothidea TaxID=55169 RepID=A0A8H4J5V3_9PEZI|nr:rna-processing protein [Botryosphaeria dothidea]
MVDATAKTIARPGKPVFKLDVPFTTVQWPQFTTADHDIMLEMLTNFLAPIGQHRSTHITPLKGKRSKKRKRHEAQGEAQPIKAPPRRPDLSRHITVGINSTTRHLEELAQGDAPRLVKQPHADETKAPRSPISLPHLPLIFTLQPPSSITITHLPLLAQMASRELTSFASARIIPLKPSSEHRLTAALGLPRVGVVGIMEDAPGARPLIDLVRQKVSATYVPWLREVSDGRYLPVNVLTEQAGSKTEPTK